MISDPVMRAIRRDVFKFRGPVWPEEEHKVLVYFGERLSDAMAVAIRRGALSFSETLDWSRGYSALESTFELKRQPHLFRVEPIWARFTEPQFTKTFLICRPFGYRESERCWWHLERDGSAKTCATSR